MSGPKKPPPQFPRKSTEQRRGAVVEKTANPPLPAGVILAGGLQIALWCPPGTDVPTEVHMHFPITPEHCLVVRFGTRAFFDEVLAELAQAAAEVWPEEKH